MSKIVCYGEVLWDVFPTHKKIGGAPLNVALRLNSLGNEVYIVSKIGNDQNGTKLIDFINSQGVSTDFIQIDENFATGTVKVILDEKGSASYDIEFPRAWDKIESTDKLVKLVEESDAFYYGSLVSRGELSQNTLFKLIDKAKYKICDLNLRPPNYTTEGLKALMEKADFLKLNDDELFEISKALGSKYNSIEQNVKFISEETNTKSVCVTKGSHGALLLAEGKLYYNSGYQIKVVDTVGAGDSFLASLISKLLSGTNPQVAINYACAVGALVAQSEGANPVITPEEIEKFVNPYG
ncbi:MAG: carbohydrate kinase [Flavobacteriaceae bacterium]|nr:carbohydrate kinase [Bacteroidia bacterium]NNL16750.1 carbohydrate kinase [Flavobacteriaceae bacterium]